MITKPSSNNSENIKNRLLHALLVRKLAKFIEKKNLLTYEGFFFTFLIFKP